MTARSFTLVLEELLGGLEGTAATDARNSGLLVLGVRSVLSGFTFCKMK